MEIRHKDTNKLLYVGNIIGLGGADLSNAYLYKADLAGADLRGADLSKANLIGANLSRSSLGGADLRGADLSNADLRGAYFRGANLAGADFSGANLSNADLRFTDLSEVNFNGANLAGAISDTYQFIGISGICSYKGQTLYIPELDKVWCGCFKGTLDEFAAKVLTYPDLTQQDRRAYEAARIYFSAFTPD